MYISLNGKPNPLTAPKTEKVCTATSVSYSIKVNGEHSLNPLYYYEQTEWIRVNVAVPTRRTLVPETEAAYGFAGKLAYGL